MFHLLGQFLSVEKNEQRRVVADRPRDFATKQFFVNWSQCLPMLHIVRSEKYFADVTKPVVHQWKLGYCTKTKTKTHGEGYKCQL